MTKSSITAGAAQSLFASAANAADKGQAQYFTPREWARALCQPLPRFRHTIVDLTCGSGSLLEGCRRASTEHTLGCDIDPSVLPSNPDFIAADVCRLLPLMDEIDWHADTFVLNPPWDLHLYREPLASLLKSDLDTVAHAMAAHDGRTSKDTIDSTVAILSLALDRCSQYGEGFLIANESTLQRLILGPDAPHRALAVHCWAHVPIAGNICTPVSCSSSDFTTGVLYFARGHDTGLQNQPCLAQSLEQVGEITETLWQKRALWRKGAEARAYAYTTRVHTGWHALGEEWQRLNGRAGTPLHAGWNLWLAGKTDPIIRTDLSLYDNLSQRIDKRQAEALVGLDGKRPMQLVMQRSQRAALEKAAGLNGPSPYRVQPELQAAVQQAVAEYHAIRAPLYPLSPIQRLGYLDEQDDIECSRTLRSALGVCFGRGQRYALRSTTVAVRRLGAKVNNQGGTDAVEWDGQELAFFISDRNGVERLFMEARLRSGKVRISILKEGEKPGRQDEANLETCTIDFTLQDLVENFVIPDVPDVATMNPEGYRGHLQTLDRIEALTGFKHRKFQREDFARMALHAGGILAQDTGLGKGIAAYIWPLLKVGMFDSKPLRPNRPVLFVATGDLHGQIIDEGRLHFKTEPVVLDSQETFLRISTLNPRGERQLAPNYYLTTYTQLARNGVHPPPELDRADPRGMVERLHLKMEDVQAYFADRGNIYREHYEKLGADPADNAAALKAKWFRACRDANEFTRAAFDKAYYAISPLAPDKSPGRERSPSGPVPWQDWPISCLNPAGQNHVILEYVILEYDRMTKGIGEIRYYDDGRAVKCVYSPSLADRCQNSFAVVVADEGTKIKGEETLVGIGTRQMNPEFRLPMTATPIKNRLPDIFHLAHWATGARRIAHPRFPYGPEDQQSFAEEFCISERNLTKEEDTGRRFVKLTPQICNVHRLWKFIAPIVLRRRKADCGEEIVKKIRQVVRVPLGAEQASVYKFHLEAKYKDINGLPATGAKLQALRIAATNPASPLLHRPEGDLKTPGNPRSNFSYVPKVAGALSLIHQILDRGEQGIVFSAFHDSLDELSARLSESGVPHLKLDGRTSQKKRSQAAREFKKGPPGGQWEAAFGHSAARRSLSIPDHARRRRVHGRGP
jgi:predicted RNA methylase